MLDPTKAETLEYLRAALGVRVVSTYGRTETAGTVTSRSMFDYSTSAHLGSPVSCNEIKLVDDKTGGYKSTDEPNPRGEVRRSSPRYFANSHTGGERRTDKTECPEKFCFLRTEDGEKESCGPFHLFLF